jgi:hypothetical protein
MDDAYLSLQQASALIRSKRISPRELTSALLGRIDILDKRLCGGDRRRALLWIACV